MKLAFRHHSIWMSVNWKCIKIAFIYLLLFNSHMLLIFCQISEPLSQIFLITTKHKSSLSLLHSQDSTLTWAGRRGSGRPAPPPGPAWCSCWTASAARGCKGTVTPAGKPPARWGTQKHSGCVYMHRELQVVIRMKHHGLTSYLDLTFFMTSKT